METIFHIVILALATLLLVTVIAFLVVDMFARVDYLKDKVPWLERVLQRRGVIGALALVSFFLLVGDGYELFTKESPPEVEAPIIKVLPPLAPNVEIAKTIPLNPPQQQVASSPSLNWTQEEFHESDGKLLELVKFSVDKNLAVPAFLAVCNRVCIGRSAGCTGVSSAAPVNSSPYAVEAYFRLPRPLPAGNDCQIDLLSADGTPFKVTKFRILKESEIPAEQR